jgi:hypothetical protein
MELAACADLRAGAEHARFGMLIGWGKAAELVLTGDHIGCETDEPRRLMEAFLERRARRLSFPQDRGGG